MLKRVVSIPMKNITDTLKEVFPWIAKPTVFQWLQRKILRPEIYWPPPNNSERQSLLSKSDIVTMGIYSTIFSLNITFNQLTNVQTQFAANVEIVFEVKEVGPNQRERIITETATNIGPERTIQHFLEEHDYKVGCAIYRRRMFPRGVVVMASGSTHRAVKRLADFESRIVFFTENLLDKHTNNQSERSPYETVTFINIKGLVKHVEWTTKM